MAKVVGQAQHDISSLEKWPAQCLAGKLHNTRVRITKMLFLWVRTAKMVYPRMRRAVFRVGMSSMA